MTLPAPDVDPLDPWSAAVPPQPLPPAAPPPGPPVEPQPPLLDAPRPGQTWADVADEVTPETTSEEDPDSGSHP